MRAKWMAAWSVPAPVPVLLPVLALVLAAGCGTEREVIGPVAVKAPIKVARCVMRFPAPRAAAAARVRLERDISGYVGKRPGRIVYAALDLVTGVSLGRGEHEHDIITASGAKVDILAALLLRGTGELDDGERDLAIRMITESDNSAADTLWSRVGSSMSEFYDRMGLRETTPGPGIYWGGTTTSPADRIRLMKLLVKGGKGMTAPDRRLVLDLMSRVQKDQSWGVSAAARRGDRVALKNGWTPRPFASNTWAITSYGRIVGPGRDLLLSVQTDEQPGEEAGIETIEGVARLIGTRLDTLSPTITRPCPTRPTI
ncbi:serine hydrolase [Nonomuraea sp. NPDC049695]|uniref:serine hydrolase n=1 Tax=Nonomuraea sp. NPDC049695 TaxID=3154734 RepID=UPI00342FFBDF